MLTGIVSAPALRPPPRSPRTPDRLDMRLGPSPSLLQDPDGDGPSLRPRPSSDGTPKSAHDVDSLTEGGAQSFPTRYMLPVGAGTPAAGSSVTAKVSGGSPARSGDTRRLPTPLASTVKTPTGTGAPLPAMARSSYALPSGAGGSPWATSRPPAVACQSIRPLASGAAGRPDSAIICVAGSRRMVTSDSWRASSCLSW